ncbi:MAG: DUF998 domain-containing protein [Opitutaceae bacterium]|jgi:hypothetical membrane protein
MSLLTATLKHAPSLARLGLGVLGAGLFYSAAYFRNIDGSFFDPLHNFVSELGSRRTSPMAAVFDVTVILGALLLFPSVYALVNRLRNGFRRLAVIATAGCMLGIFGVGLISIDHLKPHLAAALIFFCGWFATVAVFTVGFRRERAQPHSRPLIVASLVSTALTLTFLAALLHTPPQLLSGALQDPLFARPGIWTVTVLEWAVLASFCGWITTASRYLRHSTLNPASTIHHSPAAGQRSLPATKARPSITV